MTDHSDPKSHGPTSELPMEKTSGAVRHVEDAVTEEANLVYDEDEEPELHTRTWIALASMFILNLVQVFALQGPPAVVSRSSSIETVIN